MGSFKKFIESSQNTREQEEEMHLLMGVIKYAAKKRPRDFYDFLVKLGTTDSEIRSELDNFNHRASEIKRVQPGLGMRDSLGLQYGNDEIAKNLPDQEAL